MRHAGDYMGILDDFFGSKKDDGKNATNALFKVSFGFSPVRLAAMKDNRVNFIINVSNLSGENQLVSLDVLLPKKELIGFEPTCIKKHEERKIGELKKGESKEIVVPIWATNQTKQGNYPIKVMLYSHYIDYTKVLKSMDKSTTIRVV